MFLSILSLFLNIKFITFLAIGAAAPEPLPPCSIRTEIENFGSFIGPYPIKIP